MEFISKEPESEEIEEISEKTEEPTEPIQGTMEPEEQPTVNAAEEQIHIYEITADYKKSTYQIEHWTNVLSNGKHVTLLVYTYFYWGTFEIELTDKEKEEILKKTEIVLNDYSISCAELDSGCDCYEEIENEERYTEEELDELNKLIYWHKDYYDEEYNTDTNYNFEQDILELNDWDMDDTTYGFDTGCELELISD
tara:strand:- start:89 stop:676 length:588 start_codon:yes stop_codon:yes gene_type:complete